MAGKLANQESASFTTVSWQDIKRRFIVMARQGNLFEIVLALDQTGCFPSRLHGR